MDNNIVRTKFLTFTPYNSTIQILESEEDNITFDKTNLKDMVNENLYGMPRIVGNLIKDITVENPKTKDRIDIPAGSNVIIALNKENIVQRITIFGPEQLSYNKNVTSGNNSPVTNIVRNAKEEERYQKYVANSMRAGIGPKPYLSNGGKRRKLRKTKQTHRKKSRKTRKTSRRH
jgi:hypothetical protein